jgi:hypothetical protein
MRSVEEVLDCRVFSVHSEIGELGNNFSRLIVVKSAVQE